MRLSVVFDGSMPVAGTTAAVLAAEAGGLDGVWSAEHLGLHDAVSASAAYLVSTEHLEIGLVGLNASSRHPGLMAMELASLAELRPGRVRAQLGTGDAELAARIGARSPRPLAEVEALVGAVRRLHQGEEVSLEAPGFSLDRFRLRRFHHGTAVPLDVMAIRPKMLQLACRVGDGLALSMGASMTYLGEAVATARRHRAELGLEREPFRVTAMVLLSLADDAAAARRQAAKLLAYAAPGVSDVLTAGVGGLPDPAVVSATLRRDGPAAAGALYGDAVIDELGIACTPDDLAPAMLRYEGTGIDELALTIAGDGRQLTEAVEAIAIAAKRLDGNDEERSSG